MSEILELVDVDIDLSMEEEPVLELDVQSGKHVKSLSVLLCWCTLPVSVDPVDCLLKLFKDFLSLSRLAVWYILAVVDKIVLEII